MEERDLAVADEDKLKKAAKAQEKRMMKFDVPPAKSKKEAKIIKKAKKPAAGEENQN